MKISIILSTYNNAEWLEKVIWGYELQSYSDFEIVIADDGSDSDTAELIKKFQENSSLEIKHVWHPDNGFQKCSILNKAIVKSTGNYLIFTDGDCIPRADFIATHAALAEPHYFLSGGYCKLPMNLSQLIEKEDISSGKSFDIKWLKKHGMTKISNQLKLGLPSPWNTFADKITTTKPTWNGCNASTWKKDILAVNGHNEEMQYGGEDREMGIRLLHLGLKAKQVRHRAVLIHLDHARGYVSQEALEKNMSIRRETTKSGIIWTDKGIKQQ